MCYPPLNIITCSNTVHTATSVTKWDLYFPAGAVFLWSGLCLHPGSLDCYRQHFSSFSVLSAGQSAFLLFSVLKKLSPQTLFKLIICWNQSNIWMLLSLPSKLPIDESDPLQNFCLFKLCHSASKNRPTVSGRQPRTVSEVSVAFPWWHC